MFRILRKLDLLISIVIFVTGGISGIAVAVNFEDKSAVFIIAAITFLVYALWKGLLWAIGSVALELKAHLLGMQAGMQSYFESADESNDDESSSTQDKER